jgi:sensor histidine kinase YesM
MELKQTTLYWILQLTGWSLVTGVLIISALAFGNGEHTRELIQLQVLIGIVLMAASHIIRHLFKRMHFLSLTTLKLMGLVLVCGLLFSALSQGIIQSVIYGLMSWSEIQPYNPKASVLYWFNTSIILIVWSVLYIGIRTYQNRREQEVENWKLRAGLREAELDVLKAQINPHFLFNALNNVRSLISENTDLARDMVSALSDLLRYAISHTSGDLVQVSDEIHMVRQYIALEKMQYEDRLDVSFKIDKQANRCKIPPMVIQMLVENAIKHGISKHESMGRIQVTVKTSTDRLTVVVINPGELESTGTETQEGHGIGLSNIKKRLSHCSSEGWSFTINQIGENKVESKIELPCRNQLKK